jgi:hypothetical protein
MGGPGGAEGVPGRCKGTPVLPHLGVQLPEETVDDRKSQDRQRVHGHIQQDHQ